MIESKYNYTLEYLEDGVYLSILPVEDGKMLTPADLFELIRNKKIQDVDFSQVEEICKTGVGSRGCVAPPQEEYFIPDILEVVISPDKMQATLKLIKGDEGGERITALEIISRLENDFRIIHGLDKDLIGEMVENGTYGQDEIVAMGTEAKDGIDGKVVLHFDTDFNKVGADVDGRIDFKQLNLFANVNKGSVVASRTKPIPGEEGMDVCGNVLPCKAPGEAKFNYGKNILLSTDGESLLSTIDGKADVVGNKVVVSKVYMVDGNVDMSVGNIEFSGDIVITGSVMSGFTINAGGSVDVYGVVEGAHIYADKNIKIASSFLGNGKGMLTAGGSVICKSVEHGTIRATESIDAENVMHSNLFCEGVIKVDGSKSSIIGGNTCSGSAIVLNNVGAAKGTATTLKIGMITNVFKRMGEIQAEEKLIDTDLRKLQVAKTKMMSSSKVDMISKVKVMNEIIALQARQGKLVEEKARIEEMMKNVKKGKIVVRGRAFNGVDIVINDVIKRLDSTVDYSVFMMHDGEIKEYPYQ